MLTIIAFLVALGLLIAVHEYGHYRVAVACGVKVLRFSVGFGKTLARWKPAHQKKGQDTEFVLCAFPLGGYVKMLDEREGDVAPEERHLAFNTQPLGKRAAIVAAGPIANLLLAILLYACVNWYGTEEAKAVLAAPVAGSVAQEAGLRGGEEVLQAGLEGEPVHPVRSFDDLRWLLTQGALNGNDVQLVLADGRRVQLPLSRVQGREADAELFRRIGVGSPWTRPEIIEVLPDGAAARAQLKAGDVIIAIDGSPVADGAQLYEGIRSSVRDGRASTQTWKVRRGDAEIDLQVTPAVFQEGGDSFGRISARVGGQPAMVHVRYGAVEGLVKGVERTWQMSVLSLRMMGRMLIGEASLKNLSGPITIAEYAGKSASLGLTQYLVFLAVISVSLGVLNLLPVPLLDGGHLMYYLWEAITGRSVSETWAERLQRGGIAVLLLMMSIAFFNDISRHVTRLFG